MFEKLGNAFSNVAKSLGEKELKEQDIDENLSQLEISLLESDVAIEVIDKIKLNLKEKRFGFEPEVTIKLAKQKCIFYEIGISYRGRTYEEGKKIGLLDVFVAIYCIIRYSIFN